MVHGYFMVHSAVKDSWSKVGVFQCCKELYGETIRKVEPFLVEKYGAQIPQIAQRIKANINRPNNTNVIPHQVRNKDIWFCWLQGLEQAPLIVHACYNSLKRHLTDREIKVIDNTNWREYVELPGYIVEKWEKGQIPAAMLSDLLRLELLIKYGGTWIDSTVLCTGLKRQEFLDANLFVFQYTPEGTTKGISISNWFITSSTNNEVLMAVRELLYAYWKDYDCTIDYYMFHLFFEMVAREYPEQVGRMPYGSSQRSIALMKHWNEPFKQEQWDRLVSKVAFHKLSYRVSDEVRNNKDNYYNHIMRDCGSKPAIG